MAGVWSAGGDLTTARQTLAGCGTQSAGLSFGGYATSASNKTEEYLILVSAFIPRTMWFN
jgi:hypothetical protein